MRRLQLWPLSLLVLVGCSRSSSPPEGKANVSPFQPGQVWQYKARSGEELSRITILKLESHPKLGSIVHIHVDGVAIKSPKAPGGVSRSISHLPYGEEALSKSVTTLERSDAKLPAYEEGYNQWKKAFDAGKAGIWSASVSEAVASIEQGLNK